MNNPLIDALVSRLASHHGWRKDRVLPHVASRDYDTAVGPKSACVWFTVCKLFGDIYFWPEYHSEGRNAVEGCAFWLSYDATPEQVQAQLDRFVLQLEASIDQTFARRLHLQAAEATPA